ncbi:Asp-tRNA(Asn)/Glu-tRNA(Gln) amidotransferase subunit GatA [Rhodothermus bifroesti]|uniref:Glutamyl-tRNA(Gln) amidotransferase subunit A n=1 Tax=Rhodothermus marinus TaxID=29549 RepID=A0A7V2B1P6_RHOMR|nr:Asp-tRNA(Asn)/Glu-tRNA(Gln) amidotransferase subunit GatA [Rhodothermus bifroesti]GBD02663.1 Glutamyl-tRNA(Gln) amidotransferase subunit A [bacterium HR18]
MEYVTYADARRALEQGETSCEALVSSFLERIEAENARLNAFISVDAAGALAQARTLDQRLRQGEPLPPLGGLVLAVKDVICIKDQRVTCGSRMLENFVSLYDATVIERLRAAGAIFIGKTNCDEFAMGSSNETSYFGPARNPINPDYVPGGSSGGSAVAVAAKMCHAALGSDTGGSIRQPAAFCGVVGLKPTYGRVSRYGLVAYASSLDTIGPFAHTVEDVARLLQVMAGVDRWDSTSAPVAVPDYVAALDRPMQGLRIGLPREYFAEGLDPEIRQVLEKRAAQLEAAGAVVQEVSLPHTEYGIAAYYILATAEASSNLARYDGIRYGYRADVQQIRRELAESGSDDAVIYRLYVRSRSEGFGTEVKRRIMLGTYVLSAGYYEAYYAKAQRVRRLIRQDFDRAFEQVDVLLTPASPTPPFPLGSKLSDPLEMYLSDVYTVTANLAGIPGLVVPVGTHSSGFPVGAQLLGRHFDEATLLQVGKTLMELSTL